MRKVLNINEWGIEEDIIEWFHTKGIAGNTTPEAQFEKTMEETLELHKGIVLDNIDEIKDAIGDIMVTLEGIAMQYNLTLAECWEHAYNIISKRKGEVVDGIFVKEE